VRTLAAAEMLDAWEASLAAPGYARAAALLARATDRDPSDLDALPVGACDALLLELRERAFGTRMECETRCPACAERLEFTLDASALRVGADAPAAGPHCAEVDGASVTFRLPTMGDLAACASSSTPEDAARTLLGRCVVRIEPGHVAFDAAQEAALTARMAELDPQADAPIALVCPACEHAWTEPFDPAAFVAREVDDWARRTLDEVHVLAVRYGWGEREVLALSPARRRYYVERAVEQ